MNNILIENLNILKNWNGKLNNKSNLQILQKDIYSFSNRYNWECFPNDSLRELSLEDLYTNKLNLRVTE